MLDGSETTHPPPHFRPMTAAQAEIVRIMRATGQIRIAQAGRIVAAHTLGERDPGTIGRDAMTRLARRGVAQRVARGIWQAR
jgi:hypothetical protein